MSLRSSVWRSRGVQTRWVVSSLWLRLAVAGCVSAVVWLGYFWATA